MSYDYNKAGQLTRLTLPGSQVWQWAYDGHGSMVSLTDTVQLQRTR
ncbi:RHS repeat protein [Salmonella enterica]|nr:RHS repeat protein [Salmonella enterica]